MCVENIHLVLPKKIHKVDMDCYDKTCHDLELRLNSSNQEVIQCLVFQYLLPTRSEERGVLGVRMTTIAL